MLEKARLVNPKSDALWVEAVRVEKCSGAPSQGKALLARASRMSKSNVRHTLVDGNLVRGPAAAQGTQCGRPQEMRGAARPTYS